MVHGTRGKIIVRLHNYGTVWQRWADEFGVPSTPFFIKFCFQTFGNVRENKNKVDRLPLVPKLNKRSILQ